MISRVRSHHQLGFALRAKRAGLVQIGIFILRPQLKINVPWRDFDIETASADIQVPKMKEHGVLLPQGAHSGVPGRTEQSISISRCWEGCLCARRRADAQYPFAGALLVEIAAACLEQIF